MQRNTKQRVAIEEILSTSGRPLSPPEILEAAQKSVPSLNLATVYRTLKKLCQNGAIMAIEIPGEAPRYRLIQDEDRHHHHFFCNNCRKVFCLEGCVKGLESLMPDGFQLTGHDIILYGMCSSCGK